MKLIKINKGKKKFDKITEEAHRRYRESAYSWFEDNPIFYHPRYKIKVKHVSSKPDPVLGNPLLQVTVEFLSRSGNRDDWDTAEALAYVSGVVFVLKQLDECAQVIVNYNTAHESKSIPRHATVKFVYVYKPFDRRLMSSKLEELFKPEYRKLLPMRKT